MGGDSDLLLTIINDEDTVCFILNLNLAASLLEETLFSSALQSDQNNEQFNKPFYDQLQQSYIRSHQITSEMC